MTVVEVVRRWCRALTTNIFQTLGVVAVGTKPPPVKFLRLPTQPHSHSMISVSS